MRELAPTSLRPTLVAELGAELRAIRVVLDEALRVLGEPRMRERYESPPARARGARGRVMASAARRLLRVAGLRGPVPRGRRRRRLTVVAVVSQPDRPAGRGLELTAPAVKVAAGACGLPVLQPERVRTPEQKNQAKK